MDIAEKLEIIMEDAHEREKTVSRESWIGKANIIQLRVIILDSEKYNQWNQGFFPNGVIKNTQNGEKQLNLPFGK